MKTKIIPMAPEGEGSGGGGTAVAPPPAAPAAAPQKPGVPAPDHSYDAELRQLAKASWEKASVAPVPQQKTQTREVKETPPPSQKQEVPQKQQEPVKEKKERKSLFERDEPKAEPTKETVQPVEFDDGVKENDWKSAKAVRAELKRQVEEKAQALAKYEADLAQYRQLLPNPADAERVLKEHKEFSEHVALHNFKDHPDYKRQFVEPKNKILAEANAILGMNEVQGVDLAAILAKPRNEQAKALSEIESKMNSYDAAELRLHFRELRKLQDSEAEAIKNKDTIAQQFQQQAEARQRQAFEEVVKTENVGNLYRPWEIPDDAEPQEREAMEAFNRALPEVRKTAEKYAFSVADEKTAASVAAKAANYDFLQRHALPLMAADYKRLKEVNAMMAKQLEELGAHRPGADFSGGSTKSTPQGKLDPEESIEALAAKVYGR